MGTKLQYAINPLSDNSFAANHLEDPNLKRSAFDKFEYSMDKILEQHNIESIKNTMLIHEDIFQHQVRELHRLYKVQKRLIDEMKNEIRQNRFRGPMAKSDVEHSQLLNRYQPTSGGYILHFQGVRDNPSPREQSGSCSGETLRMPKGFDLERPAEEAISIGINSIDEAQTGPCSEIQPKNNNMCIDRYDESDVELTLSIGGSNSGKKRSKSQEDRRGQELDCTNLAHSKLDRGNNNAMSSSSTSTIIEQQNKMPHWLSQGLSLNRT